MVTFRLHRTWVIVAVVLALVFAVLIFVAGLLMGTARRNAAVRPAAAKTAKPPGAQSAPPPAAPAKEPAPPLTIRLGAFGTEEEAKTFAQDLAARRIQTRIVPLKSSDGITLHLVLTGQYATREEALSVMSNIEQREGITGAVIPVPEA